MSRPTTKETLLSQAKSEYKKLQATVKTLSAETIEKPGACDKWSIKDILAHLNAWHELMINWYEVGMSGEKPAIPSLGYTWKTTPALNEKIYQDNRNTSLKEVLENLDATYKKVAELIEKHSDNELFYKKVLRMDRNNFTRSIFCFRHL